MQLLAKISSFLPLVCVFLMNEWNVGSFLKKYQFKQECEIYQRFPTITLAILAIFILLDR